GIFPHGAIRWPTNLEAKLKGGAVRLAQRKQCEIYPVFFRGVRLKGFTIPSLLLRGKPTASFYPPMLCNPGSYEGCMDELAQILNQEH
ncbi:MAG: hypothetical protein R3240_12275, partial [Gammaproteobacteria bacterium]|nr:hypothetical protein [Gammaproteobacteria bacterium]